MKIFSHGPVDGRRGISFVEIVVTITVFAVMALPIYMSMSGTQSDTVKNISYLRAMELASEAIEYVKLLPMDKNFEKNATALSGSLFLDKPKSSAESIMTGSNKYYQDILADKLSYSDQYNPSFFYRTVQVGDMSGTPNASLLKKVIVTVYWDDGRPVKNLEDLDSKTRKVELACLICDWRAQP